MNEQEKNKKKEEQNKEVQQVFIEDGTMAEFGFNNPCEITASKDRD